MSAPIGVQVPSTKLEIKKNAEPIVATPSDLNKFDISCEEYREYYLVASDYTYRINNPVSLYVRKGGTTHRVIDADGVAHCVLSPETGRSVLRWKNKANQKEVMF